MKPLYRLTLLVDDTAEPNWCVPEHGFSLHVEGPRNNGLFDTGQTDLILKNATALGIDLTALDWVAISHGHYDHTGGLPAVLELSPQATLFIGPDAFTPRLSVVDGKEREIGFPWDGATIQAKAQRTITSQKRQEVVPDITLIRGIQRYYSFEQVDERFKIKHKTGYKPDHFRDEQVLLISTPNGPVLVTGCAHRGIAACVRQVQAVTGCGKIHTLIGGFHLKGAPASKIEKTVAELKRLGITRVAPCHCSGPEISAALKAAYGTNYIAVNTGTTLDF